MGALCYSFSSDAGSDTGYVIMAVLVLLGYIMLGMGAVYRDIHGKWRTLKMN